MASIQERVTSDGKVSYRVQVRIKGQPTISETFNRKTDAKRWAEMTEAEVRDKKYFRKAESKNKTLNDAISRYLKLHFVQQKKTYKDKKTYLTWWGKELGSYTLIDLTPSKVAEKRDKLLSGKSERKDNLSPASVNRYLAALSHLCTVAVKEWGWLEFNPVSHVTKSKESRGRDRYLSDDERKKLLAKIKESKHKYLYAIVLLALSTGMRRGEIMNLKWDDIHLPNKRIVLRETKNGEIRSVPISSEVEKVLKALSKVRRLDTKLLFPSERGDQPIDFKTAWNNVLDKAKITDFRFHDLRHSCASYLAMTGATLTEIAAVLGHKTLSMVKRYSHLSDSHVAGVVERMNQKIFK